MESEDTPKGNMQRQTAYKVRIASLLDGPYVKEGGWQPNYVETAGLRVSRANIIGIVIAVVEESSFKNILIDDGSGRISLRIFENMPTDFSLGDILLVIGRPREFGGDRYVVPEILKKVDQKWFEVRKLELKTVPQVEHLEEARDSSSEEVEEQLVDTDIANPVDALLSLVKRLDRGDGAMFDDVARESKIQNCEDYINRLLELGEIFEVKPGRFKVLE